MDDDFEGARLIVDHLVALGHQQIVHIAHPLEGLKRPFVLSHTARCDGYVKTMRKYGLEPDVIMTTHTEEGGHEGLLKPSTDPPHHPPSLQATI